MILTDSTMPGANITFVDFFTQKLFQDINVVDPIGQYAPLPAEL